MMRKTALILLCGLGISVSAFGAPVDLSLFDSDFNRLLKGIGQDLTPTLRLGALSGDIVGDASLERGSLSFPTLGVVASSGLGRVLAPGAYNWEFVLPLADLVGDNAGSTYFERLMLYPNTKLSLGLTWNHWDLQASGFWIPDALGSALMPLAGGGFKDSQPKLSWGNVGLHLRRTLVEDAGWTTPAVSFGGGATMTGFALALKLKSLGDIGVSTPTIGTNQNFDMGGDFGITTSSTVLTLDLHVSKHWSVFTPFVKLSGAYQNSTFQGSADLLATVTDTVENTVDSMKITSHPVFNVSDFAFLTTSGFEINLFACQLNFNVVTDLSRTLLNVRSLDLEGIQADAISFNAGLRWSF